MAPSLSSSSNLGLPLEGHLACHLQWLMSSINPEFPQVPPSPAPPAHDGDS